MVERAACEPSEPSAALLNGVSNDAQEGRILDRTGGEQSPTDLVRATAEESGTGTGTFNRANAKFSLFRWFKRAGNRDSIADKRARRSTAISVQALDEEFGEGDRRKERERGEGRTDASSSLESIDTFYSTTTVRSFAFQADTLSYCDGLGLNILKQAAEVGPFAAGATKVIVNDGGKNDIANVAFTLPANGHSRRRNITARYSLQPSTGFNSCVNLPASSRRTISGSLRRLENRISYAGGGSGAESTRKRVHVKGKRRAPDPPRVACGKIAGVWEVDARETPRNTSNRRKRRAPKPPERVLDLRNERAQKSGEQSEVNAAADGGMDLEPRQDSQEAIISNDTLVLQGGVLLSKREGKKGKVAKDTETGASISEVADLSTANKSAMPRPWYKRSVFEHSRDSSLSKRGDVLRSPTNIVTEAKEESAASSVATSTAAYSADTSLSKLSFFHRGDRQTEDRKRDVKRKSGLSILTNISELDKEAAAIVQEEQARARASMLLKSSQLVDVLSTKSDVNEELVQDIVTSAMENSPSPRRGTRALISKFNAISNITKVTVNANFFAKSTKEQQNSKLVRTSGYEQSSDWAQQTRFSIQETRHGQGTSYAEKDISRYFPQQQKLPRGRTENVETDTKLIEAKTAFRDEKPGDRLVTETSNRISYLQSQLAANRMNEPGTSAVAPVMVEKIRSGRDAAAERKEKESARADERGAKGLTPISQPSTSAEGGAANLLSVRVPKQDGVKMNVVQKEFSDIFDEIDRQLRGFKLIDRSPSTAHVEESNSVKDKVPEDEAGISSKVAKVLDILVEAEKDGKSKVAASQVVKSIPAKGMSHLIDCDARAKPSVPKSPLLTSIEHPATTDLKEMLKEMKHSLPKRPKPKKSASTSIEVTTKSNETVKDESVVSTRVSHLAKPDSSKAETGWTQHQHDTDKQKVSSSAQTSGNIRILSQPSTSPMSTASLMELPSTSGWKHADTSSRMSSKGASSSAFVKKTFQLIRPRDFAEIEAMKTTKGPYKENTYANVIEQSLYANTVVPASANECTINTALRSQSASENLGEKDITGARKCRLVINEESPTEADEESENMGKNMNTLAINRLLRKLEAAIASGHHQQAAGLAKELARLKIQCSVVRQRSACQKDQVIRTNMYIEDKLAHQGPIPLQLPTRMTVAELKTKVHAEFEIPTNVQRWIIGKNLADSDQATLADLQAVDGSPIFLYLVAPEMQNEKLVATDKEGSIDKPAKYTNDIRPPMELEAIKEDQELTQTIFINTTAEADEQNKEQLDDETLLMDNKEEEENKMIAYYELMELEDCDVIPNSTPMECPVCFVTYGPREGVILKDCLHMFCRGCLADTILHCDEAEVKCPYRDTEYTCESSLQEREIKALVELDVYQQHLVKSLIQAEKNAGTNAFHCKVPDCPGWCIYDKDVVNFLCPVCQANNCLPCQAVHTGKTCLEYQMHQQISKETDPGSKRTVEMLEDMVGRGEALTCPTCAVVFTKQQGCDWVRCSMCKTEICWATRGPRWGPGGKGDTSGGCKCGENGIKCHPHCNYCH